MVSTIKISFSTAQKPMDTSLGVPSTTPTATSASSLSFKSAVTSSADKCEFPLG
ncbi:hypothetical protein D3C73_961910 [compost metagenome]